MGLKRCSSVTQSWLAFLRTWPACRRPQTISSNHFNQFKNTFHNLISDWNITLKQSITQIYCWQDIWSFSFICVTSISGVDWGSLRSIIAFACVWDYVFAFVFVFALVCAISMERARRTTQRQTSAPLEPSLPALPLPSYLSLPLLALENPLHNGSPHVYCSSATDRGGLSATDWLQNLRTNCLSNTKFLSKSYYRINLNC